MSSSRTEAQVDVTMPQMGVSVAEGTVVEWRKQVGRLGRARRGHRRDLHGQDRHGRRVPGHGPGGGDPGRRWARRWRSAPCWPASRATRSPGGAHLRGDSSSADGTSEAAAALTRPATRASSRATRPRSTTASAQEGAARRPGGRRYSPVVARMAAEHDLDLERIEGTGRGGRVRKQDVLALSGARGRRRRAADAHRVPLQARRARRAAQARPALAPAGARRRAGAGAAPPPRRCRACAPRSAARWSSRSARRRPARRSSRPT